MQTYANQALILNEQFEGPAATNLPMIWSGNGSNTGGGWLIPNSDPNFANLYPGTQDFCWEGWVNPIWFIGGFAGWGNGMLVQWGSGGDSGWAAAPFSIGMTGGNVPYGTLPDIALTVNVQGTSIGTQVLTLPGAAYLNHMVHVAINRVGSTINGYLNGQLALQATGFTTDLSYGNIGGDGHWYFTGPPTSRGQMYSNCFQGSARNIRWTIGNNVYGTVSSFTPPDIRANIPPTTGTLYCFWPTSWSTIGWSTNPVYPDYGGGTWAFQPYNSNSGSCSPISVQSTITYTGVAYTSTPYLVFGSNGSGGTWTSPGTAPNQPTITSGGPSPVYGTTCADFTMTGTDVRIFSTDSSLANFSGSFLLFVWFYMPATITNECKSIINVETTNGMVVNIGRVGMDIDWLSINSFSGTELSYGQHTWARNAWNCLIVQQYNPGNGSAPIYAWAGTNSENYASPITMTDSGASTFVFDSAGNVSIGCPTGSSVSSEMYFNEILLFAGTYNGTTWTNCYPTDGTPVPVQQFAPDIYDGTQCLFTFQGAAGSTNIQPVGP